MTWLTVDTPYLKLVWLLGRRVLMMVFILHSRRHSISFVGGTKKTDRLIALWGNLMFPRFKKTDDIGTM